MLKIFNSIDNLIEDQYQSQWFDEAQLKYFASEIMDTLDIHDPNEISSAFDRAVKACLALHLLFYQHFKRVYRFDGNQIIADWKISAMACYLIIINCNPMHENVAKAQMYFVAYKG